MKKVATLLFMLCVSLFTTFVSAQSWSPVSESSVNALRDPNLAKPSTFSLTEANPVQLVQLLRLSPKEFSEQSKTNPNIIKLPMPDGSLQRFSITESPVMEPELAAKFPEIKTFKAYGIDDPYASARIDYNPYFGFHAMIRSVNGTVYIDPYAKGNINYYISYFTKDYPRPNDNFTCTIANRGDNLQRTEASGPCRGTEIFTYRLALACTGEYATAVCAPSAPTVNATLAEMGTSVNRVNEVYESELAVRLLLIANNNQLVYLNGATDPYTNNDGVAMLGENITTVNTVIGSANYDIGHVFSTGGGGVAYTPSVCNNTYKAGGVTGSSFPVGDPFVIDYVCHEMGHQFGGNHTFNSITVNCGGGNRNATTAYEPGSGTTIMAYAGICGSNDIQPNSDPYFHAVSYDEIVNNISTGGEGNSCKGVIANGGNQIPVITAMNNNGVTIPELTPFILSGTATDADGDALTYSWEEWDLGNSGDWDGGASSADKPLFKSRVPKTDGIRMFPDINVILAGYPASPAATMGGLKGEIMADPNGPATRILKFKLTVRDGRGGVASGGGDATNFGCSLTTPFAINVKGGTGAFSVTVPDGGQNWLGGSTQTVTWNVASTDIAPINTSNVDIFMSTDGGLTYPTTVLSNTPNDGTQAITVPNIPTNSTVRFMIRGAGNVFFDISNANFTITYNSVLPVGLIDFSVTPVNGNAQLKWNTVTEQNNRGFEIQRSSKVNNGYTTIGFIAGAGNSNDRQQYGFTDFNVHKNVRYYYRLNQIDLDNRSSLSPVRSLIISDKKLDNIFINPNPASNTLNVQLSQVRQTGLLLEVFDINGKRLVQQQFNNPAPSSVLTLDISSIASGTYLLRLSSGDEQQTLRFVKQ